MEEGSKRLTIALFGIFLTFALVIYGLQFPLAVPSGEQVAYTVKPGTSIRKLSKDLAAEGYVQYYRFFELLLRLRGKPIQAGEYCLSNQLSLIELVRNLQKGKVCQYSFTFIEGWTLSQISQALNDDPVLEHTLGTPAAIEQAFSDLPFVEGQFFPETYAFPRGTRDIDVLQRAHKQMDRVLSTVWARSKPRVESPEQLLIVASLLEKESAHKDELPVIAGVIYRRLDKKMRLQVDPTVVYALGRTTKVALSREDLKFNSPYNTYRHAGLPPTPIGLPSRAALRAAARPQLTNFLYYVSKGDGTHYFSETLAEHNEAVATFQKGA